MRSVLTSTLSEGINFEKPTNEMVRRLIPLREQGTCRGSFYKEDHRHADTFSVAALASEPIGVYSATPLRIERKRGISVDYGLGYEASRR